MALIRNCPPMLVPVTSLVTMFSVIGMIKGLRQTAESHPMKQRSRLLSPFSLLPYALFGTLYMLHWVPVMASTTARMSVRPKRLKWVKTVHHGSLKSAEDRSP
jgi:1,2-diacylglycerol 3-beta-glucosyltransferase